MSDDSQTVETFSVLWNELTPLQRRFVVSMQEYPTKKEAAEALGISPSTVYNWGQNSGVDDAVDFMSNNIALATLGILQANATKAAMVKAHGLDSDNEKIRQDVASEILDRQLGKATQRQEIDHSGAITYTLDWGDNNADSDD